MDVSWLRTALSELDLDPAGYRILEPHDENTWCLRRQGKTWLVFYFERGSKSELQRFNTEASACEYFLNKVTYGLDEYRQ